MTEFKNKMILQKFFDTTVELSIEEKDIEDVTIKNRALVIKVKDKGEITKRIN